jgi:signal transduction histidine kinase
VRRRLLASYLSITFFVLIALGIPLGVSFANAEYRRLESNVKQDAFAFAQRAGSLADAGPNAASAQLQVVVDEYAREMGARVVITDGDGDVLVASEHAEGIAMTPAMLMAQNGIDVAESYNDARLGSTLGVAVPVLVGGKVAGAVQIETSKATTAHRIKQNWLLLGGLGGLIALVVLMVSTLLARSFTRPLADLDRGAARLGDGDLAVRVEVPADPPELAGLARSFNATAERLEALVRSQQAFVADASHQLRTPLAALRLRLENLEAEGHVSGIDDVTRSLAEVQRLSQLVDSLLVLTRAEAQRRLPEPVNLGTVIADRCDAWSALANERGVAIAGQAPMIMVRSVPGRLEQVLDNLLSNALDVAPPGSSVRIDAHREGAEVLISVCDAGPGMTAEQRARAFDRFWRAGGARRDGGGFGLGLAIVRELIAADGGSVSLDESTEGGLAVRFRLPLASGAAPTPRDDRVVAPV